MRARGALQPGGESAGEAGGSGRYLHVPLRSALSCAAACNLACFPLLQFCPHDGVQHGGGAGAQLVSLTQHQLLCRVPPGVTQAACCLCTLMHELQLDARPGQQSSCSCFVDLLAARRNAGAASIKEGLHSCPMLQIGPNLQPLLARRRDRPQRCEEAARCRAQWHASVHTLAQL